MAKRTYRFGGGRADGNAAMKDILGGKGAGLAEMSSIGLPVPPGFTIATTICSEYETSGSIPDALFAEVNAALQWLEETTGCSFGDHPTAGGDKPLLISIRSGAAVSMPGMMDTILSVGLNSSIAALLIKQTGNARWVWDSYRRLIDMYGETVAGVQHAAFELEMDALKTRVGAAQDVDLTAEQLEELTLAYKRVYRRETGQDFPEDPREMLRASIVGVVKSWGNARAIKYRAINRITGLLGTAVTVQQMVFGNSGPNSGTGVLFTRSPADGTNELYGECLMNAAGEDVVAGIRTGLHIKELQRVMPAVYAELLHHVKRLEAHCKDMQDIEFTIQDSKLYILQCRSGKRNGAAAVRIAVDMVTAKEVTAQYAVQKLVTPAHLDQLLHPQFKDATAAEVITKGIAASPGAAVGRAVFTAEDAEAWHKKGETVILVRPETSAEDVAGMFQAEAVLTAQGGMTSHAAVVARGWGRPCVVGAGDIHVTVDAQNSCFTLRSNKELVVKQGDWISVNGTTGEVMLGKRELIPPSLSGDLVTFLGYARAFSPIGIRVNADCAADIEVAMRFPGVDGVGLCRTEHMFWGPQRILCMREVILAESSEERTLACNKLAVFQRGDFAGMFRALTAARDKWALNGAAAAADAAAHHPKAAEAADHPIPVTIRLLDPPLHEYLPQEKAQQEAVAKDLGIPLQRVSAMVGALKNSNPLIGYRGCRVGITHPEIVKMQVRAALEAACEVAKEAAAAAPPGSPPAPPRFIVQFMVPMVCTAAEIENQAAIINAVAEDTFAQQGVRVPHSVGTMIETPRACLEAASIAPKCAFASFGSNDLSSTTFGFSRDDAPKWLHRYLELGILRDDPFVTLDTEGVGQLIRMASQRGKAANPSLEVGICGEQAGEERSVHWLTTEGLVDYVSASPFRLPVAILAAAQAGLQAVARAAT